ncbi:DUF1127 domain-containing protein [Bosea sp. 124]|uniref:DUF1127 domain-containing protein n=1 Tax=Bosea sp. 124 TaxID=2135642 RepID=UPI000D3AFA37|nr:DUF1127 domain-containing protein [Bosea sp. 124]PTM39039.1 uncharacterized protein DUF1127 [Bosea sp. 124]
MLLMTFATKSLSSVSAGATRAAALTITPVVALVKALIHRREVLRLGELDERSLKDIGLVRSDLDGALAVSWLSDPSVVLAERSSARSGVAATRREAGLQRPVKAAPGAKVQNSAAARPVSTKPLALQA